MKKYFGTFLIALVLGLGISANAVAIVGWGVTITNSYSSGSVSGNSEVGGLVGENMMGTITDSYWDTETSGQSSSAGGTGKTTAEMKQQATFSGWDFATIWTIVEGVTYPYLQWQSVNEAPTVTTASVSSITHNSASGGGEITATGGENATARGVCWDVYTNPDPDINDSKDEETGDFGTDTFTASLTSLSSQTHYKVRAYATNSAGTGYGSVVDFRTLSEEPTAHAASFSASTASDSQIDLSFSAASAITNADGYIILQKTGSAPTGTPADATGYSAGNTIGDATVAALITNTSSTSASITGLSVDNSYYFTLIPYGYDGSNPETYNYYTGGSIPEADASTSVTGVGNIDGTYKYAWSENSGWQNFRPDYGGVTVHDTYLSGYVWAENIGWVKLGSGTGPYENTSNADWGVNREGSNLSGYAWSENVGWINFNPTHSQVTIDTSTGKFDGYAWAENVGWIHFQNMAPAEYYVMLEATAPAVTTNAASVGPLGAVLNGTVKANSFSTTVTFEYGSDTGYGTTVTADQSPVTGSTDTQVSQAISGLSPGTTYHYRVVGVNAGGTANGSDQIFTTLATTSIETVSGGSWSSASTWQYGIVPTASLDVTISHAVTLDTTGNAGDLTINSGGALAFSGTNQLTIAGNASITAAMDVAGGTCSAEGTTTVDTGGTLQVGAGSYTANGSFDASSGSVTFTGAGTLNLAGAVECDAFGTFTRDQGTVNYSGADQSVDDIDYYNLTLSGTGTKILCGALTGDNDIDGNLSIASGVTLDVTDANNYNIEIAGNWANSGTFTCQAGTVTFTGAGNSTLASGGSAFYVLTLNKSDGAVTTRLSPSADLTVTNALTITKGTFDLDTNDVNLSLGGALDIGADGRWTKSSEARTVTFTGADSTITDNSSPLQNLGHVLVIGQ